MTVRSLAKSIKSANEKLSNSILDFFVSAFDLIFGAIQRWVGVRGMPYVFVLPNLLIFGIFILFPMLLNFVYAFTGGTEFFVDQRPWVGTANFEQLLTKIPNGHAWVWRKGRYVEPENVSVGEGLWLFSAENVSQGQGRF